MVSTFLFDAIQKFGARTLGPRLRGLGLRVYRSGVALGGSDITFDRVLPDNSRVSVGENKPTIAYAHLIGQGTSIVGDVKIEENATIQFHNLIQAGPSSSIHIASNASIADLVVIKAEHGKTVSIGKNALVASNAYLRNCNVADNAVVGIGAKAYDDCVIEGMLGAGSVLLEGTTVPAGEIWAGSPAAYIRHITEEERDHHADLVYQYSKIGEIVSEEMEKPIEEQLLLDDIREEAIDGEVAMELYQMNQKVRNEGLPFANDDFATAKRLMDIELIDDVTQAVKAKPMGEDYTATYEDFPRNFNNHKANYRIHNEMKSKAENDADAQRPDYKLFEKGTDLAEPKNWTRKY